MIEQNTEAKVHHQTKRGADLALAKKQISQDSHKAVHEGRIGLDEARELGRNAGPGGPAVRANKNDHTRSCMCGCGKTTSGRFAMGHDQVLLRQAYEYLKGERELNEEQLVYVRDETNKLERAKARVEREKAERQAKAKEE